MFWETSRYWNFQLLGAIICSEIWKQGNLLLLEGHSSPTPWDHSDVIFCFKNTGPCLIVKAPNADRHPTLSPTQLQAHQPIFIHTSIASSEVEKTTFSYAVLVRNSRGQLISALLDPEQATSTFYTEYRELLRAMRWAQAKHLTNVIFVIDAKLIVSCIYSNSKGPWLLSSIQDRIFLVIIPFMDDQMVVSAA